MFPVTVRWGNRLNCWNTIPMRVRAAFRSVWMSVSSWPSKKTRPSVGSSSRLMVRSKVDFPDPEGPMSTSTSRG